MSEWALFLRGRRKVFFLGDDDHVSPLLAHEYGIVPVVYEYDARVRKSLVSWFGRLGVQSYDVEEYDARLPIGSGLECDAFYINPPYSSKSEGLGIKVWIMRALEACIPNCTGVLVMPRDGGNIKDDWVGVTASSVDEFMDANGLSVLGTDINVAKYTDTTDPDLRSSNLYLARIDANKVMTIDPAGLYN